MGVGRVAEFGVGVCWSVSAVGDPWWGDVFVVGARLWSVVLGFAVGQRWLCSVRSFVFG